MAIQFCSKRQPKIWTLNNEGCLLNKAGKVDYKNDRGVSNRECLTHLTIPFKKPSANKKAPLVKSLALLK